VSLTVSFSARQQNLFACKNQNIMKKALASAKHMCFILFFFSAKSVKKRLEN